MASRVVTVVVIMATLLMSSLAAPPTFPLQEEVAPDTEIPQATAYLRKQHNIEYKLVPSTPLAQNLSVDLMTGRVATRGRIDRETLCSPSLSPCFLPVEVLLVPASPASGSTRRMSFSLEILDVNDHAPQWPMSNFNVTFTESDSSKMHLNIKPQTPKVKLPLPTDLDSGENARLRYDLVTHSAPFKLCDRSPFASQLLLCLNGHLDREVQSQYELTLMAYDQGHPHQRSGQLRILVNVFDLNDNAPQFTQSLYKVEKPLPENTALGTVILQVEAKDADSEERGQVSYNLELGNTDATSEHFQVSAITGEITLVKKLDYEQSCRPSLGSSGSSSFLMPTCALQFIVVAKDAAPYPYQLSSSSTVEIRLQDVDDEPPVISVTPLHIPNQPPSPSDTNSGPGNRVRLYLPENDRVDAAVTYVRVMDADWRVPSGIVLTCNVSKPNLFSLVPQPPTGSHQALELEFKLHTLMSLDRETMPTVNFMIICEDEAHNRGILELSLECLDVNDWAPEVDNSSIHFTILENMPVETLVGQLRARDRDLGPNGEVRFSIHSVSEGEFRIEETSGKLYTRVVFDREQRAIQDVLVLAHDLGTPVRLTSTVKVRVDISDENDSTPEFDKTLYEFTVNESSNGVPAHGRGMILGQVHAVDRDVGMNGKVEYLLQSSDIPGESSVRLQFTVHPHTGVISALGVLDYEQQKMHNLWVVAKDRGAGDRLTSSVEVKILVQDINDNTPTFLVPNSSFSIVQVPRSSLTLGHCVYKLEARDADENENAVISYHDVSSQLGTKEPSGENGVASREETLFSLEATTGAIFFSQQPASRSQILTSGTNNLLQTIRVKACDNGSPERRCSEVITLRMTLSESSENVASPSTNGVEDGGLPARSLMVVLVIALGALLVVTCVLILVIRCVPAHQHRAKGVRKMSKSSSAKQCNGLDSTGMGPPPGNTGTALTESNTPNSRWPPANQQQQLYMTTNTEAALNGGYPPPMYTLGYCPWSQSSAPAPNNCHLERNTPFSLVDSSGGFVNMSSPPPAGKTPVADPQMEYQTLQTAHTGYHHYQPEFYTSGLQHQTAPHFITSSRKSMPTLLQSEDQDGEDAMLQHHQAGAYPLTDYSMRHNDTKSVTMADFSSSPGKGSREPGVNVPLMQAANEWRSAAGSANTLHHATATAARKCNNDTLKHVYAEASFV